MVYVFSCQPQEKTMFLNTDPHFMAAKGFRTYEGAHRAMTKVRSLIKGQKPLMIIVQRHFMMPERSDYVVVVILNLKNTEHQDPMFFAMRNIYVTNA